MQDHTRQKDDDQDYQKFWHTDARHQTLLAPGPLPWPKLRRNYRKRQKQRQMNATSVPWLWAD